MVELAQRFGVSEMTVRRDLAQLRARGQAERVHGGAVERARRAAVRADRGRAPRRARTASARPPPRSSQDGQTVMIDIGTTTLQLARHLHGRKLTVVTTNLAVIEELLPDDGDRARRARRDRAPQLPLARRRAGRGRAAPAHVPTSRSWARAASTDELVVMGHDDGRGADQARR